METEKIKMHLKQLVKSAGLPDNEESLQQLEDGWVEKLEAFEAQVEEKGLEGVDSFEPGDSRGALLMTYSGSLISISPAENDEDVPENPKETILRHVEYRSIGIRNDVPEIADADKTALSRQVAIDGTAEFTAGPIETSSPIYRIAITPKTMATEDQEELLSDVTKILTENFVDVNKTIIQ
jgi:hypothetical protein